MSQLHNQQFTEASRPSTVDNQTYRLYTHVLECENDVLFRTHMKVQGHPDTPTINMLEIVTKMFNRHVSVADAQEWGESFGDFVAEMIENILFLYKGLKRARDFDDVFQTIVAVTRFISKKAFGKTVIDLFKYFATEMDVQSFDFGDIRSMLDNYDAVKNSPIVVKVQRMCSLAFSSVFLQTSGVTIALSDMLKIYGEAAKQLTAEVDFVAAIVDLVTFVVERAMQCWHLKSFQPLFHSSKTYGKWANTAAECVEESQYLHDPETHGLTYHGYLEKLESCIEEGNEIRKFSQAADRKDVVLHMLSKLRLIRGEILTRKAAGAERRAPFSLLVHGGSGVAKSSFVRTFFGHFGKMFKLPMGNEHIYTRSYGSEYWSNFRSQAWGILLDDIASVNPNKGTEDKSLTELLQIVNNVAFCPPQAAVEDKGKTPLRAECVIATANTAHLNAHVWFSNSAAVRRRFPYIVTLSPKPEYARDDAPAMIDPSKIPVPDAGHYPDLWRITLSKVIVVNTDDNGNQNVETVQVGRYTCIYTFFKMMSCLIREFRVTQDRASSNDENLKTVELCAGCDLPKKACFCVQVQSTENVWMAPMEDSGWWRNVAVGGVVATTAAVAAVKYCPAVRATVGPAVENVKARVTSVLDRAKEGVHAYTREYLVKYMRELGGSLMKELYDDKRIRMGLAALAVCASCYAGFKVYSELNKPVPQSKDVLEILSFGSRPPATGDEKENFYHQKNDYRADMITSEQTKSWKSLEWTAICAKLANSVVAIKASRMIGDKMHVREGVAVCVGGRLYVTDNHNLPDTECVLEVTREVHSSGLTTNVRRVLDPASLLRLPGSELVFFQLLDSFDCKDITPFLSTSQFTAVCQGAVISRAQTGEVWVANTPKLARAGPISVAELNGLVLDVWDYNLDRDTYTGLCGAAVVANAPGGPVVVGLHLLGNGRTGGCLQLTREHVDIAREHFFPIFSPAPIMLESQERSVGVVPLHEKSVFRYIGNGTGRVFGQLTLPRAQPKSTVCPTIFREAAVARGFKVNTGAPVMKGKKLWRQAVLPIVEQEFLFKESVVKKCADAYIDEVFAGLSDSDKMEIASPLNLMTAINGIPGRKYIDSINRSSSAGFPWMKTKKRVCHPVPADDVWQDPIDVNDEVKERINTMFKRYLNHELAAPLFTAHAKDEPLPFAKIEIEKTRVMNGAPLDWSLLVRMVFLPVVRVIQNNKFLFESMPGAVAQSREWDDIYKFLTAFGDDKMIAGDFGYFDKKMSAIYILYAFYCIITLAKRCGAMPNLITVMWGVAYDVACSFCNFNGDLVQFLGSNPSGHPLTVIINCIVNCLYMRYCYHELNPDKEVASFREFVHLVTYGDDNEIGSNREWFNHTAISELLAKLGVKYTMADKEAESVPFLHISQTTFLKRGWRYEPDLDAVVCPIDHATLDKMMTTWIPSSVLGPYAQGEEIIRNVGVEYFWYGRAVFEGKQAILREIFRETIPPDYETKKTFPTWDSLVTLWKLSSGELDTPNVEDAE